MRTHEDFGGPALLDGTSPASSANADAGSHDSAARKKPPTWLVATAFAAVYLIWGSTYFGIRIAIDTIPPLLMAGARFLIAGVIMYSAVRFRGAARPEPGHWKDATIIGALLLLVGNGAVSWAQQMVPSSIAALMVAAVPVWMVLLDWARPGGRQPHPLVFAGVALGFAGVGLIAAGKGPGGTNAIHPHGALALIAAPMCWAAGSVFSRHARQPSSPLLAIGMQMIMGGLLLLAGGVLAGELPRFHIGAITASSAWAFLYLTLAGSLVGFTAYVWLLQVSTPARVSTYAYINPVIAVLLGTVVLGETMPRTILGAGALVLVAVVLITTRAGEDRAAGGRASKPARKP